MCHQVVNVWVTALAWHCWHRKPSIWTTFSWHMSCGRTQMLPSRATTSYMCHWPSQRVGVLAGWNIGGARHIWTRLYLDAHIQPQSWVNEGWSSKCHNILLLFSNLQPGSNHVFRYPSDFNVDTVRWWTLAFYGGQNAKQKMCPNTALDGRMGSKGFKRSGFCGIPPQANSWKKIPLETREKGLNSGSVKWIDVDWSEIWKCKPTILRAM